MLRDRFKKWLAKMARTNEEQFGKGQRLKCCDLNQNHKNTPSKLSETKNKA